MLLISSLLLGAVLGSVLGSFAQATAERWRLQWFCPQEKQRLLEHPETPEVLRVALAAGKLSPWHPARSFCFACGATIRWHENLPLWSAWRQRFRCRHCGASFSRKTLWVEGLHLVVGAGGGAVGALPGAWVGSFGFSFLFIAGYLLVAAAQSHFVRTQSRSSS